MDDYADPDAETGDDVADAGDSADHYRAPLLLHSLAEFRELIFRCLDLAEVTSVAEVGAEDGHFTTELLRWSDGRDVRVVAIDPAPSPPLMQLADAKPHLELVTATSHEAFRQLAPLDAYLIDGDHNYYTVIHELRLIRERGDRAFPIVFLHDVGWPCGRRDQYYAPDAIPEEARHEYTFDHGVIPGNDGVVPMGFRGEGEFAVAVRAGGPRNGVQTAVDDFLAECSDLEYHSVPCVFGLGVLFPREAPYAAAVADLVGHCETNHLIDRLERNRLALYITILGGEDGRSGPVGEIHLTLEQAKLHIRDLETENKALWAFQNELVDRAHHAETEQEATRATADRLAATVRAVFASNPYRAADVIVRRRSGAISRRDIETILVELR